MDNDVDRALSFRLAGLRLGELPHQRIGAEALRLSRLRHRRRPSRRVFGTRLAAAALLLVLAGSLISYVSPVASETLADAPFAGPGVRPLLESGGLVAAADQITTFNSRSTSNGYELKLFGGYTDSSRTVLLVHVGPDARLLSAPELTDQFNRLYRLRGSITRADTSQAALFFPPLEEPSASLGARLTLRVRELAPTLPGQDYLRGDWAMSATLIRTAGVTLTAPAAGELAGKSVTFSNVRVNRGTLAMVIRISNITFEEATRIVPDQRKGHPVLQVTLSPASGPTQSSGGLSGELKGDGSGVSISTLWLVTAGTYNLEVSYEGRGSLVRTIEVPAAAGQAQR